jgi:phosphoribosylglycinamide formyltransferase-1
VVVISDQPDVLGLKRAQKHAVEAVPVPLLHSLEFESATARRRAHELQVEAVLAEHCVELIVCSGYMRILTAQFLTPRLGRVVNIHPSLWGEDGAIYPGVHGIRDCLTAGETATGASVHFVSIGVDDGPLIASEMITIRSADTEESLAARVRVEIEHRLYPQVIDALAEGRVKSDGIQFHITS